MLTTIVTVIPVCPMSAESLSTLTSTMLKTAFFCTSHSSVPTVVRSLTAYPLFRSLPVIDPSKVTSPDTAVPLTPTLNTYSAVSPPITVTGPLSRSAVYCWLTSPPPYVTRIPAPLIPAVASPSFDTTTVTTSAFCPVDTTSESVTTLIRLNTAFLCTTHSSVASELRSVTSSSLL